jgi:predicted GIY-YIG superfamily endonuclease
MPWQPTFVYILQSEATPDRFYTGLTADIEARLKAHNAGESPHTVNGRPWQVLVAIQFRSQERATSFEKYLKSRSGRAFAKRHFR